MNFSFILKTLSLSLFLLFGEHYKTTVSTNSPTLQPTYNQGPRLIEAIPDEIAKANEKFRYQFIVDNYFGNPDGDTLSIRIEPETPGENDFDHWLAFDNRTTLFSGTPSCSDVKSYVIDVFTQNGKGGLCEPAFRY